MRSKRLNRSTRFFKEDSMKKTGSGAMGMLERRIRDGEWLFYFITAVLTLVCLLPMWVTVATSFSSETSINRHGYGFWPREFSLEAYRFILSNKGTMFLRSFGVTFAVVILGTAFSMAVTTCYAYVTSLDQNTFRYANALSFFAWFTTVFSGGILPWYILVTRYYHLQNNLWALFIPSGMNVFNMMVLRNNFKAIPREMFESARIDGAGVMRIFLQIAVVMAKVAMVTITLFYALGYWNDFHLSLYLTTKTELFTVQKMLYQMMSNISALMSNSSMASAAAAMQIPTITARMCMTVLTILPVLMFYPFAQKYFVQGLMVGAVKG